MQDSKARQFPQSLGFREGTTSVHTSRTIMLDELSLLLANVSPNGKAVSYVSAIVNENALGKPTRTTRQRTAKRLEELYSLDPICTLFRLLRHFWPTDQAGRPMLAFLAAAARDPLLRESTPFVLAVQVGATVTLAQTAEHLAAKYPKRFQESTGLATAQRLASSWTQAGYRWPEQPKTTDAIDMLADRDGILCLPSVRGEPSYDIFVRWKPVHEQAIGWQPDLNDGVRMNIRPFIEADILRKTPNIKWTKDRGKEPERDKDEYPWFWSGCEFIGDRVNDVHLKNADKQAARKARDRK